MEAVYRENMSLPEDEFEIAPVQDIDFEKILQESERRVRIWKSKDVAFEKGARVLIYGRNNKTKEKQKEWIGPFIITRVTHFGLIEIQHGGRTHHARKRDVKIYWDGIGEHDGAVAIPVEET